MPVSFSFVEGTTREEARHLLHRIGEMPDVETFADIEHAHVSDGQLASVVVFERCGDDPGEDERARVEISNMLRKSPHVGEIDARG